MNVWIVSLLLAGCLPVVFSVRHTRMSWTGKKNYCPSSYYISAIGTFSSNYNWTEVVCSETRDKWQGEPSLVEYADWRTPLGFVDVWLYCPQGSFLSGAMFSRESSHIKDMTDARCSRPGTHPRRYGTCYDFDVSHCEADGHQCACLPGFYVSAVYRVNCRHGGSNEDRCIGKFRCCMMSDNSDVINSGYKIKERIMDSTQSDLAKLAHYLGFGNSFGCRAQTFGEDFYKNGNKWVAYNVRNCNNAAIRLEIGYEFYYFNIVEYAQAHGTNTVYTDDIIDFGDFYNLAMAPVTKDLSRTIKVPRTVFHTPLDDWETPGDFIHTFTYMTPEGYYGFGYEDAVDVRGSQQKVQMKEFNVTGNRTLGRTSWIRYKVTLDKSHKMIPYTAYIGATFGVTLKSFLTADPLDGNHPNYDQEYSGSGTDGRPHSSTFGHSNEPFWIVMKSQTEKYIATRWNWKEMLKRYPEAQEVIDRLKDPFRFLFPIHGKYDVYEGDSTHVQWMPFSAKRSTDKRNDGEGQPNYQG